MGDKSIKWRAKDEKLLASKVKNFNSKIDRLKKKGFDETLLPEKKNYKELRSKIDNRRTFKAEMDIIGGLTKRGSEKVNKTNRSAFIPDFAKEEIRVKLREINYERMKLKHEMQNMEGTHIGQKTGTLAKEISALNVNDIHKKKFNFKNMSKKEYEKFRLQLGEYSLSRDEKDKNYRTHFYKALENLLTEEEYNKLTGLMNEITTDTLVKAYYTDTTLHIAFRYDPLEREKIFDIYMKGWNRVLKNQPKEEKEIHTMDSGE